MKISALLAIALVAAAPGAAGAVTIVYDNFDSTTGLQLNGDTAAANDGTRNVLRVTPAAEGKSGSVFSTDAIALTDSYSFSTRFTFNFNNQGGLEGADGLVFVVQTNSNSVGGSGAGIGYEGILNSLGIEFDNFENGDGDGTDLRSGSHIGVDLNGSVVSAAVIDSPFDFDAETPVDLTAWVDYNSSTQLLEIRINNSTIRPLAAILAYSLDLSSILGPGNDAFVGFTSGTGSGYANHDLASWEFRDTFAPVVESAVAEPASWAMMIAGFGLVGGAMRGRQRHPLAA